MVAGALAEAIAPVVRRLDIVRTRAAPSDWHDVRVERVAFTPGVTRGTPVWSYTAKRDATISFRRLQVLFEVKPTAQWKPRVEVHADGATIIKSTGNAFESADLDVDLYGGRPLLRDRKIELYVWNGVDGAQTEKEITVFAQFGEL